MILYSSAVYCCPVLLLKAIQPSLDFIFKAYLDFMGKSWIYVCALALRQALPHSLHGS